MCYHSTMSMPTFTSTEYYSGDNTVGVRNDRRCETFDHLVGKQVVVDGKLMLCTAVMAPAKGWHHVGEEIALHLKPIG